MENKQEIEAQWAELAKRLENDPKLLEVLNRVLDSVATEQRSRLRAPYTNASALNDSVRWH